MKFFIDTADIQEILKAREYGLVDGVTTNPTLLSRQGGNWMAVARDILKVATGLPVSLEVTGATAAEMVDQGGKLADMGSNVVVKVPMTMDGMKAVGTLRERGIRTNVTLVFSATQALLAAKAGADYVSPFVGRLDAIGQDGMTLIEQVVTIFSNYDFDTKVLVASIRSPMHVQNAALIGAHVATIPFKVMEQLAGHPLTDTGLATFMEDWKKAGW